MGITPRQSCPSRRSVLPGQRRSMSRRNQRKSNRLMIFYDVRQRDAMRQRKLRLPCPEPAAALLRLTRRIGFRRKTSTRSGTCCTRARDSRSGQRPIGRSKACRQRTAAQEFAEPLPLSWGEPRSEAQRGRKKPTHSPDCTGRSVAVATTRRHGENGRTPISQRRFRRLCRKVNAPNAQPITPASVVPMALAARTSGALPKAISYLA